MLLGILHFSKKIIEKEMPSWESQEENISPSCSLRGGAHRVRRLLRKPADASATTDTPDSCGKNSRSKNPLFERFECFPLSGGISPLKHRSMLGSNPRNSRFVPRDLDIQRTCLFARGATIDIYIYIYIYTHTHI